MNFSQITDGTQITRMTRINTDYIKKICVNQYNQCYPCAINNVIKVFLGALILVMPVIILAVDFEPQGFVDTYHAVRINDPYDFLSSRTRLRLEMWVTGEDASLFTSMNAVKNNVIVSNTGIELKEAYMDYTAEKWDLRVGRQIIVWGKADGLAITDIVSPWDYTEFLAQDFDDIRLPVDALRFRLLSDKANLEFLWLPVFRPAVLPYPGTPWSLRYEIPENVVVLSDDSIEPNLSPRNSEVGGKLSFYLPGIDFAISSFYTWDDYPTLHRTVSPVGDTLLIHYHPEHHRLTFIGAEFSKPWRDFVLRGEAAYYKNRYFEPDNLLSETMFKRDVLNWMIGLDWTPGNDWFLTVQFVDNFVLDYNDEIEDDEHMMMTTLHISKKLLRQILELSSMGYYGINEEDGFIRTNMDYSLTDEIHLLIGIDFFFGDEGRMGQYDDNDEIWIDAKYSF